jgi:hypothetical protein
MASSDLLDSVAVLDSRDKSNADCRIRNTDKRYRYILNVSHEGYHVISDMKDIAVTATLHVISVRSETFGKGGQGEHNSGSGTQVTKFQKIDLLVSSSLNLKQRKQLIGNICRVVAVMHRTIRRQH